jgi:ABC-type Fe3+-hydroxamate transport system substrate-binding protein
LERLGTLFGEEEKSREVAANLRQRIEGIRKRTLNAPKRKVLVSIGRNMGSGGLSDVYVAGTNTLYNELLNIIGAENVYNGSLDYARMSHEAIMQLAPDVIIDLIPDLETSIKMTPEEVRSEWRILKNVPAVQNGQVHVFGSDYVCVPGPRFILVLEDIARAVHLECFEEEP